MGEIIGELVAGIASVAVGFAVGSLVFVLVRGSRWFLLRSDRTRTVIDPSGGRWTVRIPLAPSTVRFTLSNRLFAMRPEDRRRRERQGAAADGVTADELAHPRRLVASTDEAASLVSVLLLVLVAVALVVLFVEALVVALAAVIVGAVRFAFGRWQCEAVDPRGRRTRLPAGSLRDARERATSIAELVEQHGGVDLLIP